MRVLCIEYFNKEYYIYYNPLICNNIEHKIRKEVLKKCEEKKLEYISITDHNTCKGI